MANDAGPAIPTKKAKKPSSLGGGPAGQVPLPSVNAFGSSPLGSPSLGGSTITTPAGVQLTGKKPTLPPLHYPHAPGNGQLPGFTTPIDPTTPLLDDARQPLMPASTSSEQQLNGDPRNRNWVKDKLGGHNVAKIAYVDTAMAGEEWELPNDAEANSDDEDDEDDTQPTIGTKRECYIPVRPLDMITHMSQESPFLSGDAKKEAQFRKFYNLVSFDNRVHLLRHFAKWQDTYGFFDPDTEGKSTMTEEQKVERFAWFQKILIDLLDKASFSKLPPETMKEALKDSSSKGVNVVPPKEGSYEFHMYYRGQEEVIIKQRSLRHCFRNTDVIKHTYDRLLIFYRLLEVPTPRKWYHFLKLSDEVKVAEDGQEDEDMLQEKVTLKINSWYFKLFKNYIKEDIDMLLPGSDIKFSRFDIVSIVLPIVAGFGGAAYKLIQSTFNFDTMSNTLTSLGVILLPLSYVVKAYMGFRAKREKYEGALSNSLLMRSLGTNAGVLGHLLDEAREQEDLEALLAYFFLWGGSDDPQPIEKEVLDEKIEAYLQHYLQLPNKSINFQVHDAVHKLDRMGILTRVPAGASEAYRVLPLDQAVARLQASVAANQPMAGHGAKPGMGVHGNPLYTAAPASAPPFTPSYPNEGGVLSPNSFFQEQQLRLQQQQQQQEAMQQQWLMMQQQEQQAAYQQQFVNTNDSLQQQQGLPHVQQQEASPQPVEEQHRGVLAPNAPGAAVKAPAQLDSFAEDAPQKLGGGGHGQGRTKSSGGDTWRSDSEGEDVREDDPEYREKLKEEEKRMQREKQAAYEAAERIKREKEELKRAKEEARRLEQEQRAKDLHGGE